VTGEVDGEDGEVLGEPFHAAGPRMGRPSGPVHQQEERSVALLLDMPVDAIQLDTAGKALSGPIERYRLCGLGQKEAVLRVKRGGFDGGAKKDFEMAAKSVNNS
jgi:hypothetical protein